MKTVVLLSGGLDSTVLAGHLLARGDEVVGLSVHYGQKHAQELEAARLVGLHYNIPHHNVWLDPLRRIMAGSSQTDPSIPVPEGHYEDPSMRITVVPNRNMLLLAVAGALAVSQKAEGVALAAHAGDHAVYPDCRPEFADAMSKALALCDYTPLKLVRPFIHDTKADIVRRGVACKAPMELTYSCYKGEKEHCGKCGTCVERREAFEKAGVPDPTKYQQ